MKKNILTIISLIFFNTTIFAIENSYNNILCLNSDQTLEVLIIRDKFFPLSEVRITEDDEVTYKLAKIKSETINGEHNIQAFLFTPIITNIAILNQDEIILNFTPEDFEAIKSDGIGFYNSEKLSCKFEMLFE